MHPQADQPGKAVSNRPLPIFNFYGQLRIFYGYIDFFYILKMDLNGFLGTQHPIKNPFQLKIRKNPFLRYRKIGPGVIPYSDEKYEMNICF